MKPYERILAVLLLVLLGTALTGWVLTWPLAPNPGGGARRADAQRRSAATPPVDEGPLDTAVQIAALAGSPREQNLGRAAIGLADSEVDLAYAVALRNAVTHPAPLSPRAQKFQQRVIDLQSSNAKDKSEIARLTAEIAHASAARKDLLSKELDLQQAQQALDADELADAQEDLARAGGDPQGQIRQAMADHEASLQHTSPTGASPQNVAPLVAATTANNLVALTRLWRQLRSYQQRLRQAQQDAQALGAQLTNDHDQLEQQVTQQKSMQSALAQQAARELTARQGDAQQTTTNALSSARTLSGDQTTLADFDKRIQAVQRLATVYGRWADLAATRGRAATHGLAAMTAWVFLIALAAVFGEVALGRLFARVESEHNRLSTLRSLVRFFVRAAALLLILLVIFGPPSQLATVLALAGAGLTVALKDFIVGFFGWFVLLGRDGIRVGDWVEINGVAGEVLEVGLFHTVLLETGNWSDADHPTGRKVSFVNSFAIEGHYFNFSTSGRWMWDELQVVIPFGTNPFPIAEAIGKLTAKETASSAQEAGEELQRLTGGREVAFSPKPGLNVKPDPLGAMISVRYLTRASERHALSARLYREVIGMLQENKIPELVPAPDGEEVSPAAGVNQGSSAS